MTSGKPVPQSESKFVLPFFNALLKSIKLKKDPYVDKT